MVLADTPSGVQPVAPSSILPSAEKKEEAEEGKTKPDKLSDVGLKTDQYQRQLIAMKVIFYNFVKVHF